MNAVFADPTADHADPVSRQNLFRFAWTARALTRHETAGSAKDQGFSEIAFIKKQRPVDSRDAALVSAMLHPATNPVENPSGMQNQIGQRFCIIGNCQAKNIRIENRLGS